MELTNEDMKMLIQLIPYSQEDTRRRLIDGEQDGRGVGRHGVHLSMDTSGRHLKTQKFMQNTS